VRITNYSSHRWKGSHQKEFLNKLLLPVNSFTACWYLLLPVSLFIVYRFYCFNADYWTEQISLYNKYNETCDVVRDMDLDDLVNTETWWHFRSENCLKLSAVSDGISVCVAYYPQIVPTKKNVALFFRVPLVCQEFTVMWHQGNCVSIRKSR